MEESWIVGKDVHWEIHHFRRGWLAVFKKEGQRPKKLIARKLTYAEAEAKGLESLGTASGTDMFHCIYLSRHGKNVIARTVAYTIEPAKNPKYSIDMTFWEKPE